MMLFWAFSAHVVAAGDRQSVARLDRRVAGVRDEVDARRPGHPDVRAARPGGRLGTVAEFEPGVRAGTVIAGAARFAFAWIEASLVAWTMSIATATPTPVVPVVALPLAVVESLVLEASRSLIAVVPRDLSGRGDVRLGVPRQVGHGQRTRNAHGPVAGLARCTSSGPFGWKHHSAVAPWPSTWPS